MNEVVARWRRLADGIPAVAFVDSCLRGISQVMFQNNPLTGALILLAIAVAAFSTGNGEVLGGALLGVVVGTGTALALRVDHDSLRSGQFGFSPLLTGIGVATFLQDNVAMWCCLILGAAGTTVVTLALNRIFKKYGLTAFTFPFVLTTWVLLMAAYQFSRLRLETGNAPGLPGERAQTTSVFNADVAPAISKGVSQVFLADSWIAGLIILVALLINNRWAAIWALVGSAVATLVAIGFGVAETPLEKGLYGFNAVLTAIAIGSVFYKPSWRVAAYTVAGIVLTLFVGEALTTVLTPLGIPVLTGPFNIATWLLLLPQRRFAPVPNHQPVHKSIFSERQASD
ncbi:urea transporter [Melissospora conviva]|uniref:urea transporter n=1 Tax=Melissospora conviva TaxID=3388432 RepID=UPI003B7B64CF